MNNAKIILSAICLLSISHIRASQPPLNHKSLWQKTIDNIGQSCPMYWFEKNITAKILGKKMKLYSEEIAEHYQSLGKEGQSDVGIPEEYHVPIKRMPIWLQHTGVTKPNIIYINEEVLNQQPYGVQRYVLFHEAIHKKYNDNSVFLTSIVGVTAIPYKLILSKLMKLQNTHIDTIRVISIAAAIKIWTDYYQYHAERRADIEGSYATQCATCIQETASLVSLANESRKKYGYIDHHQLNSIAQDLRQQNKMCAYHRNNES